ncbi:hypothetical protein SDC9_149775 [bioreactor metagenome]|uniref:Uncharacterized protein n=1 Tax=bioreactor metagenome TaxID=1076179 RepID=A0A645EN52_9ZZZZ
MTIHQADIGSKPDEDTGKQDNCSRFFDKGISAFPNGISDIFQTGEMVGRQFHDKQ